MKVTDEIFQRFSDYLAAHHMPTMRDALEAALADVPEPNNAHEAVAQGVREAIPERYLREADGYLFRAVEQMATRIAELEAKLRRVEELPYRWEARAIEQTKETQELFGPQSLVMSVVLEQLVRGVAAELRKTLGLETP